MNLITKIIILFMSFWIVLYIIAYYIFMGEKNNVVIDNIESKSFNDVNNNNNIVLDTNDIKSKIYVNTNPFLSDVCTDRLNAQVYGKYISISISIYLTISLII